MRRVSNLISLSAVMLFILYGTELHAQSTSLAPGSLTDGNVTFVFAVDAEQHAVDDQASWGSAFSGWNALPGGGLSLTSIGASYLSNEQVLFVFTVDNNHQIVFNQAVYGHSWANWSFAPPITSQFAPASTTSTKKNKVYAFATAGNDVMVSSATYGSAFSSWSELPGFISPQASSAPAALTLPETDTQWVFVQGEDDALIYTTMPGGVPTGHWDSIPIGQVAIENNGPTAVADSSHVYVFVTDALTGHIFMTQSTNHAAGTSWSGWRQIGTLRSNVSPSASIMANGEIMLYATDLNDEVFLTQGSANGSYTDWQQLSPF